MGGGAVKAQGFSCSPKSFKHLRLLLPCLSLHTQLSSHGPKQLLQLRPLHPQSASRPDLEITPITSVPKGSWGKKKKQLLFGKPGAQLKCLLLHKIEKWVLGRNWPCLPQRAPRGKCKSFYGTNFQNELC